MYISELHKFLTFLKQQFFLVSSHTSAVIHFNIVCTVMIT